MNDLLARYDRALQHYRRCHFKLSLRETYNGISMPKGTVIEEGQYEVWRDDAKWKWVYSVARTFPENGKLKTTTEAGEWLYPGQGFIWVQMKPDSNQPAFIAAMLKALPNEFKPGGLKFCVTVNGYVGGTPDVCIPELLRASTLQSATEQKDDRVYQIINATGKWGTMRLRLAPDYGYQPFSFEMQRGKDDLVYADKTLAALPKGDGRFYPKSTRTGSRMTVEAIRFARNSNTDVISAFDLRRTEQFVSGESVEFITHCHFSDFEFLHNPLRKDPFMTLTTTVPEGTHVDVMDDRPVKYEWRFGKIVKVVNGAG